MLMFRSKYVFARMQAGGANRYAKGVWIFSMPQTFEVAACARNGWDGIRDLLPFQAFLLADKDR